MPLLHCTHFFRIQEGDCNYFNKYIENDDDDRFWAPFAALSNYSTDTLIFDSQFHGRARGEEGDRPDPAVTSNHATKHTLFFSAVFVFVLAMQWVEVYHYALLLYIIPMYITYHVHNDLLCILMQCTSTELVRFGFGILPWFEVNFLAMPCIMHC